MASLLRRPIAMLSSIFCRQQHRRYRFHSLCSGPPPKFTFDVGGHTTSIETGKLAGFPDAAAVIDNGNTQVISAVASARSDHPLGSLPLTVDYIQKHTPFMPREERQEERELVCSHLIHRAIRPLFPAGFYHGIRVKTTVLSSDGMYDPDVMAANATSAALMLSDIPWNGPIGVIRVGRIDGKFIFNPTMNELSCSDLNLVYACTKDKTLMIDGHGWEITEKDLQIGLKLAHSEALKYIDPQIRLAEEAGRKKGVYKLSMVSDRTLQKIRSIAEPPPKDVFARPTCSKIQCGEALDNITRTVKAKLVQERDEESLKVLPEAVDVVWNEIIRRRIIDQGLRVAGRELNEVRREFCPILNDTILPGYSFFHTESSTAICTVALGAPGDARRLDWIVGPPHRRSMLDFSFTPISIYTSNEECERRDLNMREVAHGALAMKALLAVLPPEDDFPYNVFVHYKVHGFDGSTSMAIVCGASVALMHAGVPIREHVAGVSVGLVSDVDPSGRITRYRILTDLSGFEERLVDMDFKIAGTRKGITAIQLDIKPAGIPLDIICECLEPARRGLNEILHGMERRIDTPSTMLLPRHKIRLQKRVEDLTKGVERSNKKVRILEVRLEAKDYELRKLKELLSQKEANDLLQGGPAAAEL